MDEMESLAHHAASLDESGVPEGYIPIGSLSNDPMGGAPMGGAPMDFGYPADDFANNGFE